MKALLRVGMWCVFVLAALHAGAGVGAAQSLQWSRTYQGPLLEIGTGIALDAAGASVYVIGVRLADFWQESARGIMRRVGIDGKLIWSKYFPDELRGVAVARDGSVYVVGTRWAAAGAPVAVLRKVGPGGAEIWQRDLPNAGGTGSRGYAVAVNRAGTAIWVGGGERTSRGWDLRLAKYASDGRHVVSATYRPPVGNQVISLGIDVDREGDVYLAADVDERRAVVAKFSRSGARLWARDLLIASDGYVGACDIVAGPDDTLYVAGGRSAGSYDGVLWKLAPLTGEVLWRRVIDSGANDNLAGVATGPGGGEVCAVGGIADYGSAVIACYSPDGVKLWEHVYPSPAPGIAIAESVAFAADGSRYVAGAVTSPGASDLDLWVAKYH